MQYNYEVKIKNEKDSRQAVFDENIYMKTKHTELLLEIEESKKELAKSIAEERRLMSIIHVMEADIRGLVDEVFNFF